MKPSDIYKLPEIRQHWKMTFDELVSGWHSHIPEIDPGDIAWEKVNCLTRIDIKVHVDHFCDYERICRVASVWFDEQPVMIVRHAGRSGTDEYSRFITDRHLYTEMVEYAKSKILRDDIVSDVFTEDEDIEVLDFFYGAEMSFLITDAEKKMHPRYKENK